MKKSFFISSVLSKINLPITRFQKKLPNNKKPTTCKSGLSEIDLPGFEKVLWQFADVSVSGEIEIVFASKFNNKILCLDVPATTGFLVTCIQGLDGSRKLAFGASLS